MRAAISVIDENGNRFEGEVELSLARCPTPATDGALSPSLSAPSGQIDFALPLRAFVRTYAKANSGGAGRFTVLLAYLAKGSDAEVQAEKVRAEWSKLTAHLGVFNRAHVTRAKDRAWVDSTSSGLYRLGPRWREAFE